VLSDVFNRGGSSYDLQWWTEALQPLNARCPQLWVGTGAKGLEGQGATQDIKDVEWMAHSFPETALDYEDE
jgi:hypothetical protein